MDVWESEDPVLSHMDLSIISADHCCGDNGRVCIIRLPVEIAQSTSKLKCQEHEFLHKKLLFLSHFFSCISHPSSDSVLPAEVAVVVMISSGMALVRLEPKLGKRIL